MNVFKIAAGLACGTTLLLFSFTLSLQTPENELFTYAIEILMHQEGFGTEQEVLACYPILAVVRADIDRMADLKQKTQNPRQNPAPDITEAAVEELELSRQRITQLQQGVQQTLSRIISWYAVGIS